MFKEELALIPKRPGCYLMKDKNNTIIYVGKAKVLFNRVKSYFNGKHTGKTQMLVSEITSFDYVVTSSEVEAFILELNLIKKYNPKYNILLRDDKSYPYIELTNEKIPRLIIKRELNIKKKKSYIYGPFQNAGAARTLVNLINRIYPLKKCRTMNSKGCLYYHIGECAGYCINNNVDVDPLKNEINKILSGHSEILINKIKEKIFTYSESLNYEQALELKRDLDYINVIFQEQKVELNDGIDRDIINYYLEDDYISIQVFYLRNGKLISSNNYIKPIVCTLEEELEYFIVDLYLSKSIAPKEVIIPSMINANLLESIVKTKFVHALRGKKKHLLDLTKENAKINLKNKISLLLKKDNNITEALNSLKSLLKLTSIDRIECFDNSNLFGTFTVSGMVVYINGIPSKKDYRKFKISVDKNDDVFAMKECIYRRYYHQLINKETLPDLILVDGGINQINAATSVLNDLNLNIKVCGMLKNTKHSIEKLIDLEKEYNIDKTSNLFHFLNKIDDSVHNFTINYHKQIRDKSLIASELDLIPGIGETRKKMLIQKYKSLSKISELSLEKLKEDLPDNVAINLYNYLKNVPKT